MADFFLAYSDVGNVYACEGKSAAVKINDSTLVAFSTSFGSPGFYRFFYDEEGQRQREVVGILEWEL